MRLTNTLCIFHTSHKLTETASFFQMTTLFLPLQNGGVPSKMTHSERVHSPLAHCCLGFCFLVSHYQVGRTLVLRVWFWLHKDIRPTKRRPLYEKATYTTSNYINSVLGGSILISSQTPLFLFQYFCSQVVYKRGQFGRAVLDEIFVLLFVVEKRCSFQVSFWAKASVCH